MEFTVQMPPPRPALLSVMNSGLPETPVTVSVPRGPLSMVPPSPGRHAVYGGVRGTTTAFRLDAALLLPAGTVVDAASRSLTPW
ncbi:hypothetical protein LZG04_11285 [Saccharothrix sp. S26]|uniref:hypothetical protein n=1 Tax=Saccharothrix sp. S26 TaxID=2907215 RepID=UPI001F219C38|nr:hypothetical protein [Saccharothrix sp. S26]MCE6995387.1 hypothetical protein [Saccharothrix sp. S26]